MGGRVNGKIALVTGAASVPGLGSATAIRLAQEGATVFLTDMDLPGAEAVAAGIRQAGGRATALRHDVTRESDWDEVVGAVIAAHGRLDILVNNAGIALLRMIDQLTTAEWLRQNDVNLNSLFYGTQRAVREMRRVGTGGSIINLSSVAGMIGIPGCSAYSASKGGVRQFTRSVAMETAREGIRVNAVMPGMIMTNMQKLALQDNPAQYEILTGIIPMGRMGEPDDIAHLVVYLASEESRYVTGAEFVVDGGLTVQ